MSCPYTGKPAAILNSSYASEPVGTAPAFTSAFHNLSTSAGASQTSYEWNSAESPGTIVTPACSQLASWTCKESATRTSKPAARNTSSDCGPAIPMAVSLSVVLATSTSSMMM